MFNSFKEKIKSTAEELNAQDKGTEIWDKFYPKFETVIINGFLDIAEDKLTNEEDVKLVINKVYELLPTLVRLTLSRELFVEKIFIQKDKILEQVILKKGERKLIEDERLLLNSPQKDESLE